MRFRNMQSSSNDLPGVGPSFELRFKLVFEWIVPIDVLWRAHIANLLRLLTILPLEHLVLEELLLRMNPCAVLRKHPLELA